MKTRIYREYLFREGAIYSDDGAYEIQVMPFRPDRSSPYYEKLAWATSLVTSYDGTEERKSLRDTPQTTLIYDVTLAGELRQRFQNKLYTDQGLLMAIPAWHMESSLTQPTYDGNQIVYADTRYRGFDRTDWAIIYAGPDMYEVFEIHSVTDTEIRSTEPIRGNWTEGASIFPVHLARLPSSLTQSFLTGDLATAKLEFEYLEDELIEPKDWPTRHNGHPVVPLKPNWRNGAEVQHNRNRQVLDNGYSRKFHMDQSKVPFIESEYLWWLKGKANIHAFKQWLYAVQGMYASYWMSTWTRDISLRKVAEKGDNELLIGNVGYTRLFNSKSEEIKLFGRTEIQIVTRDGLTHTTTVTGAHVSNDPETETLSIDPPLPAQVDPELVVAISFVGPHRMADDAVELSWVTNDLVEVKTRSRLLSKMVGGHYILDMGNQRDVPSTGVADSLKLTRPIFPWGLYMPKVSEDGNLFSDEGFMKPLERIYLSKVTEEGNLWSEGDFIAPLERNYASKITEDGNARTDDEFIGKLERSHSAKITEDGNLSGEFLDALERIYFPKVTEEGNLWTEDWFLSAVERIYAAKISEYGHLHGDNLIGNVERISIPKITEDGNLQGEFLGKLERSHLPKITDIGNLKGEFLDSLERIYFPKVTDDGNLRGEFLDSLERISIPKITDDGNLKGEFLDTLERIYFPKTSDDGNLSGEFLDKIERISFPKITEEGNLSGEFLASYARNYGAELSKDGNVSAEFLLNALERISIPKITEEGNARADDLISTVERSHSVKLMEQGRLIADGDYIPDLERSHSTLTSDEAHLSLEHPLLRWPKIYHTTKVNRGSTLAFERTIWERVRLWFNRIGRQSAARWDQPIGELFRIYTQKVGDGKSIKIPDGISGSERWYTASVGDGSSFQIDQFAFLALPKPFANESAASTGEMMSLERQYSQESIAATMTEGLLGFRGGWFSVKVGDGSSISADEFAFLQTPRPYAAELSNYGNAGTEGLIGLERQYTSEVHEADRISFANMLASFHCAPELGEDVLSASDNLSFFGSFSQTVGDGQTITFDGYLPGFGSWTLNTSAGTQARFAGHMLSWGWLTTEVGAGSSSSLSQESLEVRRVHLNEIRIDNQAQFGTELLGSERSYQNTLGEDNTAEFEKPLNLFGAFMPEVEDSLSLGQSVLKVTDWSFLPKLDSDANLALDNSIMALRTWRYSKVLSVEFTGSFSQPLLRLDSGAYAPAVMEESQIKLSARVLQSDAGLYAPIMSAGQRGYLPGNTLEFTDWPYAPELQDEKISLRREILYSGEERLFAAKLGRASVVQLNESSIAPERLFAADFAINRAAELPAVGIREDRDWAANLGTGSVIPIEQDTHFGTPSWVADFSEQTSAELPAIKISEGRNFAANLGKEAAVTFDAFAHAPIRSFTTEVFFGSQISLGEIMEAEPARVYVSNPGSNASIRFSESDPIFGEAFWSPEFSVMRSATLPRISIEPEQIWTPDFREGKADLPEGLEVINEVHWTPDFRDENEADLPAGLKVAEGRNFVAHLGKGASLTGFEFDGGELVEQIWTPKFADENSATFDPVPEPSSVMPERIWTPRFADENSATFDPVPEPSSVMPERIWTPKFADENSMTFDPVPEPSSVMPERIWTPEFTDERAATHEALGEVMPERIWTPKFADENSMTFDPVPEPSSVMPERIWTPKFADENSMTFSPIGEVKPDREETI